MIAVHPAAAAHPARFPARDTPSGKTRPESARGTARFGNSRTTRKAPYPPLFNPLAPFNLFKLFPFNPLALLALFTLSACRPEPLAIDVPEQPPQLVVFAQIVPDRIMTVLLSETLGALDFDEAQGDTLTDARVNELFVGGATVTVSYAGRTDTLFETADVPGLYASLNTPQTAGVAYTLVAAVPDGRTLTATTTMQPPVRFAEVLPVVTRGLTDTTVRLDYAIEDEPGEQFYLVNVYAGMQGLRPTVDVTDFLGTGGGSPERASVLLSDAAFAGEVFRGKLELPNVAPTDTIAVAVSRIEEGYYDFLGAQRAGDNPLAILLREPITPPTNVEGGLGYFSAAFPTVRVFDLNEY